MSESPDNKLKTFAGRPPVIVNLVIICLTAVVGIAIVYFSLALFTKHGRTDIVPGVENMSYTEAVSRLYDLGFRVDIRDSLYKDNVRPGYVIEQYPKANSVVKPGRKIFLYINAVHPKEVVIDDDNHPMEYALKSFSYRSGIAKLEELGFKNIRVVRVLGDNDCIVKVLANGQPVRKMQRVPVNGRLFELRDSLQNEELLRQRMEEIYSESPYDAGYASSEPSPETSQPAASSSSEEETEFF